jgi:hypothetical protein
MRHRATTRSDLCGRGGVFRSESGWGSAHQRRVCASFQGEKVQAPAIRSRTRYQRGDKRLRSLLLDVPYALKLLELAFTIILVAAFVERTRASSATRRSARGMLALACPGATLGGSRS